MIPPKEDPKWTDLLRGQVQHQFQLASAAMIVSRCQRQVFGDPSPNTINKNVDELYAFFSKFENVAGDDLNAIFSE
jgi:hypothetical protein